MISQSISNQKAELYDHPCPLHHWYQQIGSEFFNERKEDELKHAGNLNNEVAFLVSCFMMALF
jgi:hypothetical protein